MNKSKDLKLFDIPITTVDWLPENILATFATIDYGIFINPTWNFVNLPPQNGILRSQIILSGHLFVKGQVVKIMKQKENNE